MEEDRYQQEISTHIERETRKQQLEDGGDEEGEGADLVNQFKQLVATQKAQQEEKETVQRMI